VDGFHRTKAAEEAGKKRIANHRRRIGQTYSSQLQARVGRSARAHAPDQNRAPLLGHPIDDAVLVPVEVNPVHAPVASQFKVPKWEGIFAKVHNGLNGLDSHAIFQFIKMPSRQGSELNLPLDTHSA